MKKLSLLAIAVIGFLNSSRSQALILQVKPGCYLLRGEILSTSTPTELKVKMFPGTRSEETLSIAVPDTVRPLPKSKRASRLLWEIPAVAKADPQKPALKKMIWSSTVVAAALSVKSKHSEIRWISPETEVDKCRP